MWGCEFENFGNLLSACDFSQAAIDVLRILRLTEADKPINAAENALTFVYNNLPSDLVLSKEERQMLTSLSQMAHIFDIADFEGGPPFVRFFSVDFDFRRMERSLTQHAVHSIIAREAPYCSVAIFRNSDAISMSVSFHKESKTKTIFLSDWYKLYSAEMDEFLTVIGTAIFSLKSGVDFAGDLIYLIARDYYIHPLCYEYLHYELNTDECFLPQIVEKYGDDYIVDAFIEASNAKVDTIDEIDFDLIEYELKQMDFPESEGTDEDEFENEFPQTSIFDGEERSVVAAEIPKEVLADPILLLKWLDEHSSEKSEEAESFDTQSRF